MPSLFRDLLRQRFRTLLTVFGVALGIFTLVVLGGLGEHFRILVHDARSYARGVVRLFTKTNTLGINPGITEDNLASVRALPGVRSVEPTLALWFDGFDLEDDPLAWMVPKPIVEGLPAASAQQHRSGGITLLEGRWLQAGDQEHAMVVDWLAIRRKLKLGGKVTIRHTPYEIVGIYHAPDSPMIPAGFVPYEVLNERMLKPEIERMQTSFRAFLSNPLFAPGFAQAVKPEQLDTLASSFASKQAGLFRLYEVVPADPSREGTRALAQRLRTLLPHIAVIEPDKIEERMESMVAIFLVITTIVTVLSTVVGGLLILNTMAMVVLERRREIAIRTAMGATPAQIVVEFVAEAALLALIGALLGILLGVVSVALTEPWLLTMLDAGTHLFEITPRLVAFSILYAVVMGILAGGVPAFRAARIDPAVVLREL